MKCADLLHESSLQLIQYAVHQANTKTVTVLADEVIVANDGSLVMFRDDMLVHAFAPGQWLQVHGKPCQMREARRRTQPEVDYCDE